MRFTYYELFQFIHFSNKIIIIIIIITEAYYTILLENLHAFTYLMFSKPP